jgi:hypothetical protein
MKLNASLGFLLVLSGCAIGAPAARNLPVAVSPQGIQGSVAVAEQVYQGELLTVTDSAIVLAAGKLMSINRAQAGEIAFGPYVRANGRLMSAQQWETLRMGSRFPYGIPPTALEALLRRYEQTAVEVVPKDS